MAGSSPRALLCSRDAEPLERTTGAGVTRWQCRTCHGAFLEHLSLDRNALMRAPESPKLRCPRDGVHLRPVRTKKVEFAYCGGCGGVWLPRSQVHKLVGPMAAEGAAPGFLPDIVNLDVFDGIELLGDAFAWW